ncbi:sensor histidine kinase [Enterococcus faecalis]|jgi:two-component system sensor histidine kinase AgrC|uniref:sensor histidine kinase n=1 Tax=Enterococcus faecalis TaxID=1351 RepID=UPI000DE925F7|nr:sensor histidine kinase [Enterococcus faecalis]EGO7775938.1 sensor histidine kinase [Enterococcus faecalis]EGO8093624.1 sensor histidine kinase [Enterococcus faecalis]EHE8518278.1 sensor histidine kinase [Enterococcus faecalis]EHM3187058.1 GHKL domain-containing protein [Enterococcus faecalis]
MLDITLRSLSLLVYLFLISYFFSNWSTAIKNHREFYNVIWIVIIISAMVTIILSNAYIPNIYLPYLNLLLSFILTYTIAMLHSVPYLDSAVWTMTLISINLICEVLSLHFTKIILNAELTSYDSPTFFITSITITTLIGVAWIVILKFSIVKEAKSELSTNLSFIVILLPIPILSIIILFGLLIGNNNDKISEITITISVIFLNICVIFLYKITIEYQKNQYDLTLRKKNIEVEYRILNEIKRNRTNVLKLKHDLKNQYLTILGLIENEEVNEAIDYIKSSFDILEPPTKTYAADGVLNYLLNEKLAEARKNQINVDHQIFVSKNIKINNDVLTIVIGNIIDNAIQASKRIKPIDRYVNIIIKQVNNDLFIEVSNNYNSEEIFTRKHRKNKGLGMKNIDDLLQQLGGIQRHWTKERRYFVTIVIFNVYKGNKCGDN